MGKAGQRRDRTCDRAPRTGSDILRPPASARSPDPTDPRRSSTSAAPALTSLLRSARGAGTTSDGDSTSARQCVTTLWPRAVGLVSEPDPRAPDDRGRRVPILAIELRVPPLRLQLNMAGMCQRDVSVAW